MIASDFADTPLLREQVKELVVRHVLETRVADRIEVTDAQVSAFYEANPGAIRGEYARVSQIVLAEPAECAALRDRIGSAEEFAALARDRSTDAESADRGGDLGYVMNHAGPLGFEEQLFSLEPGQMAVYRTTAGCHLVRVSERVTPAVPPLENVAPRIRGLLARQQEIRLLRELLDEAATRVTVERATEVDSP